VSVPSRNTALGSRFFESAVGAGLRVFANRLRGDRGAAIRGSLHKGCAPADTE